VKLCFINKFWEEHVQIINLINTRGAHSVNELNYWNKRYTYSRLISVHWQFISIPPPPHLLTSSSNYSYHNLVKWWNMWIWE